MKKPASAICVNEFTLARLLISTWLGRRPWVIGVDPLFPKWKPVLEKVVDHLVCAGKAMSAIREFADLAEVEAYFANIYKHDIFHATETWHDKYFEYDQLESMLPKYAMACKNSTVNSMRHKYLVVLATNAVTERSEKRPRRIYGLTNDTLGMYQAYFGAQPSVPCKSMPRTWALFNLPLFFLALSATAFWLIIRVRPVTRRHPPVFVISDFVGDIRDVHLMNELADGGERILIPRQPADAKSPALSEMKGPYRMATPESMRLGGRALIVALWEAMRDGWQLYKRRRRLEPQHYLPIALLPYRRFRERAIIQHFKPSVFWCRNETNPEHSLRRQEMHRIGGKTLGVQHGSPTHAIVQPMWRYIDMDVFYVFGMAIYDKHWKATWARDMTVRAVGSFGARRQDYVLAGDRRAPNILVMVSLYFNEPEIVEMIRRLAQEFPDRRVFVQMKKRFVDTPAAQDLIARATDGLANVEYSEESIFELFRKCRYAFSDPSTVLLEAVQFGVSAFFMDVSSSHRACVYRWFSEICVATAEEAVEKVRALSSGEGAYPRKAIESLVPQEAGIFYDLARKDAGLT